MALFCRSYAKQLTVAILGLMHLSKTENCVRVWLSLWRHWHL